MLFERAAKLKGSDMLFEELIKSKKIVTMDNYLTGLAGLKNIDTEEFKLYFWNGNDSDKKKMSELVMNSLKANKLWPDESHLMAYCYLNDIDVDALNHILSSDLKIEIQMGFKTKNPNLYKALVGVVNVILGNTQLGIRDEIDLKNKILNIINKLNKEHNLSLNTTGTFGHTEIASLVNLFEESVFGRLRN
jgi:hypothetical protein